MKVMVQLLPVFVWPCARVLARIPREGRCLELIKTHVAEAALESITFHFRCYHVDVLLKIHTRPDWKVHANFCICNLFVWISDRDFRFHFSRLDFPEFLLVRIRYSLGVSLLVCNWHALRLCYTSTSPFSLSSHQRSPLTRLYVVREIQFGIDRMLFNLSCKDEVDGKISFRCLWPIYFHRQLPFPIFFPVRD